MNEGFERFVNMFTCFFGRIGTWFLYGESLANMVCNQTISSADGVEVATFDVTPDDFLSRCATFQAQPERLGKRLYRVTLMNCVMKVHLFLKEQNGSYVADNGLTLKKEWIMLDEAQREEVMTKDRTMKSNGLWGYQIEQEAPYVVMLPYFYGTVLDNWKRLWWKDMEHNILEKYHGEQFFSDMRRRNADELLSKLLECGEKAGIRDSMWPGFGFTLGVVMVGDYIPHDRDIDMCLMSDEFSKEKEDAYLEELHKPHNFFDTKNPGREIERHFFEKRERAPVRRTDTERAVWCSLGPKSITHEDGIKSCQWFWFDYQGFSWHTKGGLWLDPQKFNQATFQWSNNDDACCKGIPSELVKSFETISFHGIDLRIPTLAGSCCDWWYPGWHLNKGGASRKLTVLIVGNWKKKNTWRFV
jgi:hypothetical protein